ncbi:Zeta-crystallin [Dactylella cylindrospora]|nr:Zeta-crystallin [Dactylella cylindrospora]
MKSLVVNPDLSTSISELPIPRPGSHEILIKVVVAGANPKDWKLPFWYNKSINSSDDIGGIVEEVGEGVFEFKKGDRVAAYHFYQNPAAAYAEYAIAPDWVTFKIPDHISFEEAATIPLAALTGVVGLYDTLRLPYPWTPATKPIPLVVYGAATAVGAYAIQLARLSNIHPIIGVVGRAKDFAETLIDRSKGDDLVDYREGSEALIKGVKAALAKNGFESSDHVFDAVSEHGSSLNSTAFLGPTGKLITVLPLHLDPTNKQIDSKVNITQMSVGWVFEKEWPEGSEEKKQGVLNAGRELGYIFTRFFSRGLDEGWFKPHPHEVIEGGLNGVSQALKNLRDGKASAVKYVFRIADTK